ncbi:recombinase family protein [Bradyrhizobium liaoningense]|uniref:recombinase family protein n=1 Tax=Bradyrhizobium liaoningense TaxID=43992 RepID=UPI002011BDA7|nr:recombinase family protein [Bradyrhizobium liaoningense]
MRQTTAVCVCPLGCGRRIRTGCDEIFEEQVSPVSRREELERCLKFVRKGDSLVVTKLDRLARSIPDLVKIIGALEEKEATLN